MHSQRLLVATIFIPLFVGMVAFLPAGVFFAFLAVGAMLALREWTQMTLAPDRAEIGAAVWEIPALLSGAAVFVVVGRWGSAFLLPAFFGASVLCLAAALFGKGAPEGRMRAWALSFLGALYVGLGAGVQMPIRLREDGVALVFFLYLVTAAGDIGAYYVGKAVGRHKMAPAVSPGKTWEGSAGHVAASVGAAALAKVWFCGAFGWGEVFALGVLLSAVGQMGDLAISLLKRACGVKDTGTLLPGHGGVLDRADAFLLTGPALWLWLAFTR